LGIINNSITPKLYECKKNRIVAILQTNSSLLVIGEQAAEKSVWEQLALELKALGSLWQSRLLQRQSNPYLDCGQFEIDARSLEAKC